MLEKNSTMSELPSRPSGPRRMYFKGPGGGRLNQSISSENIRAKGRWCQMAPNIGPLSLTESVQHRM